jgi:hypothetical protein
MEPVSTRRVAEAFPPLVNVTEAVGFREQSTPPEAEQDRETAPAKPFVEVRLMTSVWNPAPVPDAGTLRTVDAGAIVKSLNGLAIVTVVAEGWKLELPEGMYWTEMRLVPWNRPALSKLRVAVEVVEVLPTRLAEARMYSEATR